MQRYLAALGEHLAAAGEHVRLLVVGGAALALRGWIPRATQDVDVLAAVDDDGRAVAPKLSDAVVRCVRTVARDYSIPSDWLNVAVASQWRVGLPPDVLEGIEWREFGTLVIGLAGRSTLIALKLFAAADSGADSVHCQDLIALRPTRAELNSVRDWVVSQDALVEWGNIVDEVIDHVEVG